MAAGGRDDAPRAGAGRWLVAGAGWPAARTRRRRSRPPRAGGGKGIMGDPTAGGPVDAAGIPLARRDYPVTLPRIGDPVKAGEARERRRAADLQLRRLPQPGGHQGVRQAGGRERAGDDVRLARRGVHEALDRPLRVRRHLHRARPPAAAGRPQAAAAAELRPDPEPGQGRSGRSCTARSTTSGRATRSRTRSTRPGSAGATTSSATRPGQLGWDTFWRAEEFSGQASACSTTRARGSGWRCMRRGVTDLNTEDPAQLAAGHRGPAGAQPARAREGDDHRLRDAAGRAHVAEPVVVGRHAQRGHLLPAQGDVSADVLSYWYQRQGGPVFNDCICVGVDAQKPVIAHRFLNYLLDPKVALDELRRLRRLPAAAERDRRAGAVRRTGLLPKGLATCVVTREDYANGNAYLALTADGPADVGPRLGGVPQRMIGTRIWSVLAAPGMAWLAAFFLVAFYAVVAVGLGNVTDALRAGAALEPARLERRLHPAGAGGRAARAGARGRCSCGRCSTSWSPRSCCRWRSATRSPTTCRATRRPDEGACCSSCSSRRSGSPT